MFQRSAGILRPCIKKLTVSLMKQHVSDMGHNLFQSMDHEDDPQRTCHELMIDSERDRRAFSSSIERFVQDQQLRGLDQARAIRVLRISPVDKEVISFGAGTNLQESAISSHRASSSGQSAGLRGCWNRYIPGGRHFVRFLLANARRSSCISSCSISR